MDFAKTIINAIKIWVNNKISIIEDKIFVLENKSPTFIQTEEPPEVPEGSLWVDLDEESPDIIEIEIDSELNETSENPVQNKVINAAINNLNTLIGDTAVAEQIENAIASIPEAPVTSVNGQTGDIVINIPSVEGLATETYVNNAIDNIEMPEVPVTSVNGMTGDIQINIPTVEGLATEEYVNNAIAAVDVPVTSVNGMTGDVVIEIPESFSGSWNDLTDKPFGETGNGAIITWDGNTEGLDVVNLLNNPHYKVSNLVPTLEDISIGYNTLTTKGIVIPDDSLEEYGDFIACPEFTVARKDNIELNGNIIPKAGIYFSLDSSEIDYQFLSSLSFNGKTITWDGETEGLEYISPLSEYCNQYKVSDYIPSNDELTNLIAEKKLVRQNGILINDEKHLLLSGGNVLVVYEIGEYDDAGNIVNLPSTGIYFLRQDGAQESYASKFEYGNITIQTIDEKFIPDTIARKNDILVTSVNGMTGDVIIETSSNDNQIFWTEEETALLFSGTDLDFSEMVIQQTADFEFVEGAEYTMIIDGVTNTYTGTKLSYGDISYVFIGNMSSGPLAAVQNGILLIMIQDGGIHSVEISGLKQTYHFDENFVKASQSNWSEEDTNSINYINNKPFYKDLRKEVALIADRQRTYTKTEEITSNGEPIYYTEATLLAEPIIGESYRIGASAVEMVNRECQHNGSFKYLGNLHLYDREQTDTRESFCFVFEEGPMIGENENTVGNRRYVRIYTTRPVDKTYSFIFGKAYEYVSIDNRYLNCFVPWLSDGASKGQVPMAMNDGYRNEWKPVSLPCWLEEGTPVVEEFTAECTKVAHQYAMYASCNDAVESVTELYKNFKYTVIWNGRPYEVHCDVTTWTMGSDFRGTAYFLGNLDLFDFDGRYADESSNAVYPTYSSIPNNRYPDLPFLIFVNDHNTEGQLGVVYVQGNEPQTVTVGIYAGVHQYHQLDERFIPDTIARVSDIPAFPEIPEINYPVTSVNGQTGDIVIDIPSTEGLATEEYVNSAITNINTYYTKAEIDNMEFIALDEIDAICARTIEVVTPTTGTF